MTNTNTTYLMPHYLFSMTNHGIPLLVVHPEGEKHNETTKILTSRIFFKLYILSHQIMFFLFYFPTFLNPLPTTVDDVEDVKDEVQSDLSKVMKALATDSKGVMVHASTLGALEALLQVDY